MQEAREAAQQRGTLERKLPLAMAGLLTITVVVFGAFAFREVRQSSVKSTTQRLRSVSTLVEQTLARGAAARLAGASRIASDSLVKAAGRAPDRYLGALNSMLNRRRPATDTLSLISQSLIDHQGRRHLLGANMATPPLSVDVTSDGEAPAAYTMQQMALDSAVALSRRENRPTLSALYAMDGEARYWVVAPLDTVGRSMGAFVEERRIRGTPTADQQLRAVTGQDFTFYLTDDSGRLWVGPSGEMERAPFDIGAVTDSFVVDGTNNDQLFGRSADIGRTSWKAVLVASSSSVHARSLVFLQRMLGVGVLLLITSGLVAWWISRQVTRPLHSLAEAAKAIADGDFTRREVAPRNDELGMLANSFNRMAMRVGDSHRQLETRIAESELLASTLEQRNRELQTAQQLATDAKITSDIARAEAQRASVAKSEFLAMMSHELRTPLSAIAGYAEILQLGIRGPLSEAARNDVARIQANQVHLLRIINDILDVAQVESGALMMSLRPVPLHEILRELEAIVRPLIDEKGLQYSVTEHAMSVHVSADAERLTQVLVNLVANAVRFTDRGGVVRICASVADGRVLIRVNDTGVGIAPELQEQVFQPFVQVDVGASRRTQGTGLGLAISRRLVEAMGGRLTLSSELGAGSTFFIELAEANGAATHSGTAEAADVRVPLGNHDVPPPTSVGQ